MARRAALREQQVAPTRLNSAAAASVSVILGERITTNLPVVHVWLVVRQACWGDDVSASTLSSHHATKGVALVRQRITDPRWWLPLAACCQSAQGRNGRRQNEVDRSRPSKIDRIAARGSSSGSSIMTRSSFSYPPLRSLRRPRKRTRFRSMSRVELGHDGSLCVSTRSENKIDDPALLEIAVIVRGADTEHLDLAPQAAGLLAISLGLSRNFPDDHEQLAQGIVMYDALYSWAKHVRGERHTWNPQRGPVPVAV
jgi:hypothetical protein